MKKYALIFGIPLFMIALAVLYIVSDSYGLFFFRKDNVSVNFSVDEKSICINRNGEWEHFEIRGVDMGTGIPGRWSTDFAADKETYLRWFHEIKEMGANTVRIYTVNPESFYDAFYEFNKGNDDPLYLLQGVWVDEQAQNSHIDAFDQDFADAFRRDCRQAVDVIHGKKTIGTNAKKNVAKGSFSKDVSPWVIGYIIGVEWEPVIVAYTNDVYVNDPDKSGYSGEYLYTAEGAAPFEVMLCQVGDDMMRYESGKYGQQRLLAFSNWPSTDPFEYPEKIKRNLDKYCGVDVEHIRATEKLLSGQFASYHVYPYYPDYLNYMDDWTPLGINRNDYITDGIVHSYLGYLGALVKYHSIPVVISEFGIPSSRGMASRDPNQGLNQGGMSEKEQGDGLSECYSEIVRAGCAGSCVFSWQDEWFKRTWNTMHAVNLRRTCYWSDYQTNEQHFGLLSFDPLNQDGCFNDGDVSEWTGEDLITSANGSELYMKSDEKYVYFRIHCPEINFEKDVFYIPVDVTPKSGSISCASEGLNFDRAADFLIVIHGKEDSRILVHERYDALRSSYAKEVYGFDTYITGNIPAKDSPVFTDIRLPLQEPIGLAMENKEKVLAESYITGKLQYGVGKPGNDYVSDSDFYHKGNEIEIRIPWQILNFSDPSTGEIHDDYYEHFGISYMNIKSIYAGVMTGDTGEKTAVLYEYRLPKFSGRPETVERLKESYYIMQKIWNEP